MSFLCAELALIITLHSLIYNKISARNTLLGGKKF